MPSDSGSIVVPARLPRGSPCSDGSTYAVCTLRGHALGTVLGSDWHGCCALISPRCPWDGGGALIGSLQKVDRPVGRWRPASPLVSDGSIVSAADVYSHGPVSPIHDWVRFVSGAEPTVDERRPTWQDSPSFRWKRPRGTFHAWTGRGVRRSGISGLSGGRLQRFLLRRGGHFSHTTPSPSPSRALGTIHLGNPCPPPLLPCTRRSPAAWAASQLA